MAFYVCFLSWRRQVASGGDHRVFFISILRGTRDFFYTFHFSWSLSLSLSLSSINNLLSHLFSCAFLLSLLLLSAQFLIIIFYLLHQFKEVNRYLALIEDFLSDFFIDNIKQVVVNLCFIELNQIPKSS